MNLQAIDLIDEAGSRVRLQHAQLPEEARELDKELRALTKEKSDAVRGQDFEKAGQVLPALIERLIGRGVIHSQMWMHVQQPHTMQFLAGDASWLEAFQDALLVMVSACPRAAFVPSSRSQYWAFAGTCRALPASTVSPVTCSSSRLNLAAPCSCATARWS